MGCRGLRKHIQHYLWYALVRNESKMNRRDFSGLNCGQIVALRGIGRDGGIAAPAGGRSWHEKVGETEG